MVEFDVLVVIFQKRREQGSKGLVLLPFFFFVAFLAYSFGHRFILEIDTRLVGHE